MKDTVKLPHIHYGQEEAAELERASLRVQHIFDKTQNLLEQYLPVSLRNALSGIESVAREQRYSSRSDQEDGIFQKWVKSPKGWKCIGYERYRELLVDGDSSNSSSIMDTQEPAILHDQGLTGRMLQMVIWSLFEKIQLLHPFLGDDPFFTDDEMEVISDYLVPTYLSPLPLKERGKDFKTLSTRIPLYQEHIPVPSLVMSTEGVSIAGNWMTGVNLSSKGFTGLRPYLKIPQGGRTYLKALIV